MQLDGSKRSPFARCHDSSWNMNRISVEQYRMGINWKAVFLKDHPKVTFALLLLLLQTVREDVSLGKNTK